MKPTMTLEQIEREQARLSTLRFSLESERFRKEILPKVKATVGKTFVFRNNSNGSGKKWDTFLQVQRIATGKHQIFLVCCECDINGDGKARIETRTLLVTKGWGPSDPLNGPIHGLSGGWAECPVKEYQAARLKVGIELRRPSACIRRLKELY